MSRTGPRVDWSSMIDELIARGWTTYTISDHLHMPRSTICDYRRNGAEPNHSDGEHIIEFWCQATGSKLEHVPRTARWHR